MRCLPLLLLSHCRFGLALRTLPAAPARLLGRGRRGAAAAAAQLRMSAHEYADGLPIAALLPEVVSSLRAEPNLVLEAPPGAGKTTTVPLALLRDDGADAWSGGGGGTGGGDGSSAGLIMVLEPRRVAARGAAHRMASLLGQSVGGEVGYTVRHESRKSKRTRVLVVTEGVLVRRLQSDPGLEGVAAVVEPYPYHCPYPYP